MDNQTFTIDDIYKAKIKIDNMLNQTANILSSNQKEMKFVKTITNAVIEQLITELLEIKNNESTN